MIYSSEKCGFLLACVVGAIPPRGWGGIMGWLWVACHVWSSEAAARSTFNMAYAQNQEELTTWESFLKNMHDFKVFLYNKEKGEVMGRDGKSWGKVFASS